MYFKEMASKANIVILDNYVNTELNIDKPPLNCWETAHERGDIKKIYDCTLNGNAQTSGFYVGVYNL